MKFSPTKLPEVIIIDPLVHRDDRGFFFENYHQKKFKDGGIDAVFVQDNHSRSVKSTLRGLHFQVKDPQGKLMRCTKGEVFDVAVDIRRDSPRFRQWVGVILSEENSRELYVPPGFAHGFVVLSDVADVQYKCTDFYNQPDEKSLAWNDPSIGIDWPEKNPLLSPRDKSASLLKDLISFLPATKKH